MPLQTANQYQLTPDINRAIAGGLTNRAAIQKEDERERLKFQAAGQLATRQRALGVSQEVPEDETQQQAMQRAIADDPAKADKILGTLGIVTQNQKEGAANFANKVLLAASPEQKRALIQKRIAEIDASGGDSTESRLLLGLTPEELKGAMNGLSGAALNSLQRQTAATAAGRVAQSRDPIFAPQQGADGKWYRMSRNKDTGVMESILVPGFKGNTAAELSAIEIEEAQKKGKIKEDTALVIGKQKSAMETATKSFDMVEKIRSNNIDLGSVLGALDEGASTGPIVKMWPSFKASTIKLDNLRGKLGLNVVGAVTFGALSKGELDLAKAVALPNLPPKALAQWVRDKMAAQEKLATYYEEQAIFLETGSSQGDWLKMKRKELTDLYKATGATEQKIKHNMKKYKLTRVEVLNGLRRKVQEGVQ